MMSKLYIALLALVTAVSVGCSRHSYDSVWKKSDLNNLTIDLISETKVEWMSFGSDGYVSVTAGERGGPLVGPLFYWKIDADGSLLVDDEDGQIYYKIRKIELTDTKLVAEINGKQQTYKRLK
jgi:hypothetical protein